MTYADMDPAKIKRTRWQVEQRAQAAYEAGKYDIEDRYEKLWHAYSRLYTKVMKAHGRVIVR